MNNDGYLPIENHGVIGDLHTVALVGTDGSIDFMSYPHFGSPTIFCLPARRRARRPLPAAPVPRQPAAMKQMYLPDTNVLITRSLDRGRRRPRCPTSCPSARTSTSTATPLVRRAKGVRGESSFDIIFDPRFDYGRAGHKVDVREGEILFHSEGPDGRTVRLRSQVPLEVKDGAVGRHVHAPRRRDRRVRHGGGRARSCRARQSLPTTSPKCSRTP